MVQPPEKIQNVSCIIPAFEEEETIEAVVEACFRLDCVQEVIVVDDGSRDRTAPCAQAAGARIIRHPYNIGNGAAIKSGMRQAKGKIFVLMDGDGQHDPQLVPKLLSEIDDYAMVVGARDFSGHASFFRFLGNRSYNLLAAYVTRQKILDLTSGFRAIRADVARKFLYLLPNTFSYPTTLTLALIRAGDAVHYRQIQVNKRRKAQSKIRFLKDGSRFFLIILKITMLFSPLRIFLPVSALLGLCAIGNYAYTFIRFHRFTNMSVLLAMAAMLIFMLGLIAEQIAMLRMDRSEDA